MSKQTERNRQTHTHKEKFRKKNVYIRKTLKEKVIKRKKEKRKRERKERKGKEESQLD